MRLLIVGVLLACFVALIHAQDEPSIEYFTVDKMQLNYADVEGGTEAANFSWRVTGLRDGDKLQMHALVGGQWALIGEGFEAEKTDRLVIAHPLDFVLPLYRLSVVDSNGIIITEQFLELGYAPPEEDAEIGFFLLFSPSPKYVVSDTVFDEALQVHWRIINRPFNSNPVIEQIMPDGTVVNVEFERPVEWQYAFRTDFIQPVDPGVYEDIVLRLRLVNRDDSSTIVQKNLILHVDSDAVPPPEVISFRASADPAIPGDTITLSWDVNNTDAVWLELFNTSRVCHTALRQLRNLYEDLPPSGTLEITIPDYNLTTLDVRLITDYYLPETSYDYQCATRRDAASELSIKLTDYIGYGVESFEVSPNPTIAGETVTVSWEVTQGESVTIHMVDDLPPDVSNFIDEPYAFPFVEAFINLPLSGSLDVTIPYDPSVPRRFSQEFLLYIVDDNAELPLIWDAETSVVLDIDRNLDCDRSIAFVDFEKGATILPDQDVDIAWDSCGFESTYLEIRFDQYVEHLPVDSLGNMTLRLPVEEGHYAISLHYELGGEFHYLLVADYVYLKYPSN